VIPDPLEHVTVEFFSLFSMDVPIYIANVNVTEATTFEILSLVFPFWGIKPSEYYKYFIDAGLERILTLEDDILMHQWPPMADMLQADNSCSESQARLGIAINKYQCYSIGAEIENGQANTGTWEIASKMDRKGIN
jgi:hypothetical protein